MSKRMRELFENARRDGRKLFIPYVTAGFPRYEDTVPILLACEAGGGDIIEPDDAVCSIGSGGGYALAAARALLTHTDLPARKIAEAALAACRDWTESELTDDFAVVVIKRPA